VNPSTRIDATQATAAADERRSVLYIRPDGAIKGYDSPGIPVKNS
jgi:hypothetical protein